MTVYELIGLLSSCDADSEVLIESQGVSYGKTPASEINKRSVTNGFDWNKGRVVLKTVKQGDR